MAANRIVHALIKYEGTNRRFSNPPFNLKSVFASSPGRSVHSTPIMFDLHKHNDEFYRLITKRPLPSLIFFNPVLKAVAEMRHYSKCLDMFNEMCAVDVEINDITLCIVTKCYSRLYESKKVSMVLGFYIKRDITITSWAYNTILYEFFNTDSTDEAEKLFKKFMKHKFFEPGTRTYNTMIDGLCKIRKQFTAISLLRLMDGRDWEINVGAYNTIIDSLCKDMMIDDALRLFEEMKFHKWISPDVSTYNSLLYAFSMSGRWIEVFRFLEQMYDAMIRIDSDTFNILIKALCKQGKMKEAEIVDFIKFHVADYGYRDRVTCTSLIDGYCLKGELNRAMSALESMVHHDYALPTVDIYNRLLDSFCILDDMNFWSYKRDLDFLYGRAGLKIIENSVTRYIWYRERMSVHKKSSAEKKVLMQYPKYSLYLLCLMDHCDKYQVDAAMDLFYFMDGKELNSNTDVYNILIDGARICGRFDISRRLFHDLFVKGLEPNLDTYVFMIRGFCERGLLKDAKKLLLKMEERGLDPKSVIKDDDDDIIQEYMETKRVADHVTKLFIKTKRRGYSKRVSECSKYVVDYFKTI